MFFQKYLGQVQKSIAGPVQHDAAEALQQLLTSLLQGVPVGVFSQLSNYNYNVVIYSEISW